MVQLREVATNLRSKVSDLITTIRSEHANGNNPHSNTNEEGDYSEDSNSIDNNDPHRKRSASHSDGTPRAVPPPNEGERASKVIQSLVTTLFGACSGSTNCPTATSYFEPDRDNQDLLYSIQKKREAHARKGSIVQSSTSTKRPGREGKGKKSSVNANSMYQKNGRERDLDESYYAQYYADDHAQAAKAVLASKEKEQQQREACRQNMQTLTREAQQEANLRLSAATDLADQNQQPQYHQEADPDSFTPQQHRERIQVGGTPYRICEVALPASQNAILLNDEDTVASYNYDDGISALSAHTLEEMVKMEAHLKQKEAVPTEQGFDIHTAETTADMSGSASEGPPGLASTDESGETSTHSEEIEESSRQNTDETHDKVVDFSLEHENDFGNGLGRMQYPVQMARNRSTKSAGSFTTKSSKSDFSSVWKKQEQQYWMQVVEEDGPLELAVASNAAKKAASKKEKKTKSHKSSKSNPHPHETMKISSSDVLLRKQKKKKSKTSRPLFGRKKGYITYEENEGETSSQDSPIGKMLSEDMAEV